MKKLLACLTLAGGLAIAGAIAWHYLNRSTRVRVVLAERDGLEVGDPVRQGDTVIGRVTAIDKRTSSTLVTLQLTERPLPRDVTFMVATGRETRWLAAHILNPESDPLVDGETVVGVGSMVELLLRQGAGHVAGAIDKVVRSEWGKATSEKVDKALRDLERIDWEAAGREVQEEWRVLTGEISELAAETADEGRRVYERLEPRVRKLAEALERSGKGPEAERLRRRLAELWESIREP